MEIGESGVDTEQSHVQDLKKQAADAATETSKKGKKYSDSTQKETLKKLQSSQGYASKQLETLKKEADAQYKTAQVACLPQASFVDY